MEDGRVQGVAFSPDGKTLAAGFSTTGDGGVVLWDAATRRRLAEDPLLVVEGGVSGVAFGPDGRTLAAGYAVAGAPDGGMVLWDVAARRRLGDEPLVVSEGRRVDRGVQSRWQDPRGRVLPPWRRRRPLGRRRAPPLGGSRPERRP